MTFNPLVIDSDEKMSAYLESKHAEILLKNPNRDFELIWKRGVKKENGNFAAEIAVIWLDGKGEIIL